MKKWLATAVLAMALLGLMVMGAWQRPTPAAPLLPQLEARWAQLQDSLELELRQLRQQLPVAGRAELQEMLARVRRVLKQLEYWISLAAPGIYAELNAPPLPRVELRGGSAHRVWPPSGLQLLEERLYDPTFPPSRAVAQADSLLFWAQRLRKQLATVAPTEALVLQALRNQVLRLLTLGLAGWDSPAAGQHLRETATALAELDGVLTRWAQAHPDVRDELEGAALHTRAAIKCLQNAKPDALDAFALTRDHLLPLFAHLVTVQNARPEWKWLAAGWRSTTRPEATTPFDSRFPDPWFFSPPWNRTPNPKREQLGNVLFYDPVLSLNLKRSCASCHDPQRAFTDGLARSRGFEPGTFVGRNSPTLINSALFRFIRHDAQLQTLEEQMPRVLFDHAEFRMTADSLVQRLRRSPEYVRLFRDAYDAPNAALKLSDAEYVQASAVYIALASYLRSLVRLNSPFDAMINGLRATEEAVQRGYNLFVGKAQCATCHFAPVFGGSLPPLYTDTESEVLGTLATWDSLNPQLDADLGRYEAVPAEPFRRAFRTPTLRNVDLTAPYMHNGAFPNLQAVVEFYNRGGGAGMGLDVPNQTLPAEPLNLTAQEKTDLVRFLESLTDTTGTTQLPATLPRFPDAPSWNQRRVGGEY